MNTLKDLIQQRKATTAQIEDAQVIASEIRNAWKSREESELGKYKQEGYLASIGSPHFWWEQHCISYCQAAARYPISRDLNTVCLLADLLLLTEKLDG